MRILRPLTFIKSSNVVNISQEKSPSIPCKGKQSLTSACIVMVLFRVSGING